MNTCGSCKHWCNLVGEEHLGTDNHVYGPHGFGVCQRIKMDERKDNVVVKDASGYYAAIHCKADFGCILHEQK